MAIPEEHSPTIEQLHAHIPEDLFTFGFTRGGGPGGQNVNKVSTRVTLLFDVAGCEVLTDTQKRRIRTRLRGRVSAAGVLRVVAARHRTQLANRREAIARVYELLMQALQRLPTRRCTDVPTSSRRRRLREKRLKGRRKQLRGAVRGDPDE